VAVGYARDEGLRRVGREIYVMRCDNQKGGEKRRMVSGRLFANRASVKVEAQANKGIGRVEEAVHG
jgi:hypothetical protein